MAQSMIDTAYEIIEEAGKAIPFNNLLVAVGNALGIDDEEELLKRAGFFYTDLTLDGRLIILPNNFWDLKSRHASSDYHIDMNEVYTTEESEDDEGAAVELGQETEEDKKNIETSTDDDDDSADITRRKLNEEINSED